MIDEYIKAIRYEVDIYADGSDVELMTRKRIIEFAEEQVCEWYDEIQLRVMDEHGNVISKYAEGYRLADKIVNENYRIQSIGEVEELFKLPSIEIPFEIVYV